MSSIKLKPVFRSLIKILGILMNHNGLTGPDTLFGDPDPETRRVKKTFQVFLTIIVLGFLGILCVLSYVESSRSLGRLIGGISNRSMDLALFPKPVDGPQSMSSPIGLGSLVSGSPTIGMAQEIYIPKAILAIENHLLDSLQCQRPKRVPGLSALSPLPTNGCNKHYGCGCGIELPPQFWGDQFDLETKRDPVREL